jgi:hypothetical protein
VQCQRHPEVRARSPTALRRSASSGSRCREAVKRAADWGRKELSI